MGSYIGGYPHVRIARSVKSDLYAKALVLEANGKRLAIVANDLVVVTPEIVQGTRKLIAERCGIEPEAVMICATHTHTSAEVRYRKSHPYDADPEYNADLVKRIARAVERACHAMFDAKLYVGKTEAAGLSRNRSVRLQNGRDIVCYSDPPKGTGHDDEIVGYAGPVDPSVQTLCVEDSQGRVRAMAVNFAAHPNKGRKADYYWAQWPGEAAAGIAEKYGKDVVTLVLQGAAGDISCAETQEKVGRAIGDAAIRGNEPANRAVERNFLDKRLNLLGIPYARRADLGEVIGYFRRLKELTVGEKRRLKSLYKYYDVWEHDNQLADVPVQCLRVGDTAIVGLPVEPFAAIGLEIKKRSPARRTFVVGYANDKIGYMPTVDQANRCGYGETPCETRHLAADAAEIVVEAAVQSLHDLWPEHMSADGSLAAN